MKSGFGSLDLKRKRGIMRIFIRLFVLFFLGYMILSYSKEAQATDSTWVKTRWHPKLTINTLSRWPVTGKLMAVKEDSLLMVQFRDSSRFELNDIIAITRISRYRNRNEGITKGLLWGLGFGTAMGLMVGLDQKFDFNTGHWYYKLNPLRFSLCVLGFGLLGATAGANRVDKKIDFSKLSEPDKKNTISKLGGLGVPARTPTEIRP